MEKVKKRDEQEEFPRLFRFLVFPSFLNRNVLLFPWTPILSFTTLLYLSSVFHFFYNFPSYLLQLFRPFSSTVWKERKNHIRQRESETEQWFCPSPHFIFPTIGWFTEFDSLISNVKWNNCKGRCL